MPMDGLSVGSAELEPQRLFPAASLGDRFCIQIFCEAMRQVGFEHSPGIVGRNRVCAEEWASGIADAGCVGRCGFR